MSTMTMGSVFVSAVDRFPERTALVDPEGDVRYSYAELDRQVRRVAAALQASDVGPGDRVATAMENRAETVTLYWASQLAGATFVPFNFRSAPGELAFLANNVSADLLVFSDVSRESVLDGRDQFDDTDDLVFVGGDVPETDTYGAFLDRADGRDAFDRPDVDKADESIILHTSGTTGYPKGVPVSHRANYARTVGNPIHLDWQQGESTLGIMPNFHEMGRAAISSAVLLNGTYVCQRKWSPAGGLGLVEAEGIDILYLVPTLFHDIVDFEDIDEYDISSVRTVGYAGTAMSERVHERVFELFDPDTFANFYGSSEMNAMTTCRWLDEKPGCAGRAGIHTRMRVVTPVEGGTVSPDETVETGELGEVVLDASSAEAFEGYLDRPEANETSFQDGWYFTGDLGYLDDDGDLFVVGRVDDMMISGGENIYPVEVEDVLDASDLVGDVAIGSVSDERWGEVVTAFVVPDSAGDYEDLAEALDSYCKRNDDLADFKRPRKYVFVDEVPMSRVGKKLRRKLRVDDLSEIEDVTIRAEVDP